MHILFDFLYKTKLTLKWNHQNHKTNSSEGCRTNFLVEEIGENEELYRPGSQKRKKVHVYVKTIHVI